MSAVTEQTVQRVFCECGCGAATNDLQIKARRLRDMGVKNVEIAEMWGMNPGSIKSLLRRVPSRFLQGHQARAKLGPNAVQWACERCGGVGFAGADREIPRYCQRRSCMSKVLPMWRSIGQTVDARKERRKERLKDFFSERSARLAAADAMREARAERLAMERLARVVEAERRKEAREGFEEFRRQRAQERAEALTTKRRRRSPEFRRYIQEQRDTFRAMEEGAANDWLAGQAPDVQEFIQKVADPKPSWKSTAQRTFSSIVFVNAHGSPSNPRRTERHDLTKRSPAAGRFPGRAGHGDGTARPDRVGPDGRMAAWPAKGTGARRAGRWRWRGWAGGPQGRERAACPCRQAVSDLPGAPWSDRRAGAGSAPRRRHRLPPEPGGDEEPSHRRVRAVDPRRGRARRMVLVVLASRADVHADLRRPERDAPLEGLVLLVRPDPFGAQDRTADGAVGDPPRRPQHPRGRLHRGDREGETAEGQGEEGPQGQATEGRRMTKGPRFSSHLTLKCAADPWVPRAPSKIRNPPAPPVALPPAFGRRIGRMALGEGDVVSPLTRFAWWWLRWRGWAVQTNDDGARTGNTYEREGKVYDRGWQPLHSIRYGMTPVYRVGPQRLSRGTRRRFAETALNIGDAGAPSLIR